MPHYGLTTDGEAEPVVDAINAALAGYGAVGIFSVVAMLAVRSLFKQMQEDHDQELQRLADESGLRQQRADRLEAELGRLNESVRNDYINTIARTAQTVADAQRAVADAMAAVRRS